MKLTLSHLCEVVEKEPEAHVNCDESLRIVDRAPRSENDLALEAEQKVV